MTTAYSGVSVAVLLSVLCLGTAMMFVGGWYFQSSLAETKEQQQEFHSLLVELKTQGQETVQQLREIIETQGKQLVEIQLQLSKVSVTTLY